MNINPIKWFLKREMEFSPPHFVKTSTPTNSESILWIISTLSGRYCISQNIDNTQMFIESSNIAFFEDPAEAMMYELRWSGSK
jgi:hypothetical protein